MTLNEYSGNWIGVIDVNELNKVTGITGNIRKPVCPGIPDVFRSFTLCPYEDLKVVMIGQDPYPQKDIATGVLFGNRSEVSEDNLSPSLKTVKEASINFEVPHNGIVFDQTLELIKVY
nr:MAG TPA: uracil-DNA glycosylase [Crassvirales sp.]